MSPTRIVTTRLLLVTTSIQRMRITAKVKIIVHNPQKRILILPECFDRLQQ